METYIDNCKQAIVATFGGMDGCKKDVFLDLLQLVWFCKSLGNHKALFMSLSSQYKNRYWEVTYNGSKREYYVDEYQKVSNKVIAIRED